MEGNSSKTLLTGDTIKGHITLTASDDAGPVDHQQACVMANVSLNFVMKATYASSPLSITVKPKEEAADATEAQ